MKEERDIYANPQTLEIPYQGSRPFLNPSVSVDVEIEVVSDTENVLTELGKLFVNACKEKKERES